MESSASGTRTVEVTDEAYDLLARTAEARGTTIREVVDYLMQVPAVPAPRAEADDCAE